MKNSVTPKPMNGKFGITKLAAVLLLTTCSLLFFITAAHAQNDTPCECSQRWEQGDKWDDNGEIITVNNPNVQPKGIVRCGNGAETQSNIQVEYQCKYNPSEFLIELPLGGCTDPLNPTGGATAPMAPTQDKPIIWFNFDTRAGVMDFQAQWNDNNAADEIGWALYYSTSPSTGTGAAPHYQSGDCAALQFYSCGVESGNTWYNIAPPSNSFTNWYLAVWDQNGDDDLDINNFKARKGCGTASVACLEITCPAPDGGTFQCIADMPSAEDTYAGIEVMTNCAGNVTYVTSDLITGSCLTDDLQVLRTTTVFFTPDDGSPLTSESCTIVYYFDDTTSPIAPPAPGSETYQCQSDVPVPGSLTATDNCTGDITVVGVDSDNGGTGCASDPLIITRTWTFTDDCGNSSSVSQTITVIDTEGPDAYDPTDVTNVSCIGEIPCPSPTDPVIAALMAVIQSNSLDCHSFTVALQSATALRTCSLDGNGNYTFGRTFTFRLTDACGNSTDVAVNFTGTCQPHCTFTQGAWGNAGGAPASYLSGFSGDEALINHLIANYGGGKLRIGNQSPGTTAATSKYLDISSGAAVLALLPGGGPSAALASIVGCNKNGYARCNAAGSDGSLKNTLATQVIALQLNIWLGQYKGLNLGSENLNCIPGISSEVLNLLGPNPTVAGLLSLSNSALGGNTSSSTLASNLTAAVDKVNQRWDNCVQPNGNCSAPLLLAGIVQNSFDAWKAGQHVNLRWIVSRNLEIDYFVVERSLNGVDYELLTTIAVTDGEQPEDYSAVDMNPERGINHYQLVAYLKNGEIISLPEQQVEFKFEKAYSVVPNPAQHEAFVDLSLLTNRKDLQLVVTNLYGRTMLTKQIDVVRNNFERLDLSDLGEGIYFVSIRVDREIYTSKLLIAKGE